MGSVTEGKVIGIASGKGGVGKTITTVHLGLDLKRYDNSVVVVDGDLQMPNLADWFGIIEPHVTLQDVLTGTDPLEAAIYERDPNLAVLPGGGGLDAYAAAEPARLKPVLAQLKTDYDYTIIDTGNGFTTEHAIALATVDEIILVTSPDPAALRATHRTKAFIARIEGTITGVVITKVTDPDTLHAVTTELQTQPLAQIPYDDTIEQKALEGTPLRLHPPESHAAKAYAELGSRLVFRDNTTTTQTTASP